MPLSCLRSPFDPFLFHTVQREKDLLNAVDNQQRLLQESEQRCVEEETRLCQLEEQIRHSEKEVSRFITICRKKTSTYMYKCAQIYTHTHTQYTPTTLNNDPFLHLLAIVLMSIVVLLFAR